MAEQDLIALGVLGAFAVVFALISIAFYIYHAIALMHIAQKTKTQNAWLAWIPIANLYLMTQIAKVPWWTFLAFILVIIPFIGPLAFMAVVVWWWWMIAERRKMPGWYGILTIIPIVNLVIIGIIAWKK